MGVVSFMAAALREIRGATKTKAAPRCGAKAYATGRARQSTPQRLLTRQVPASSGLRSSGLRQRDSDFCLVEGQSPEVDGHLTLGLCRKHAAVCKQPRRRPTLQRLDLRDFGGWSNRGRQIPEVASVTAGDFC